jgi:hypothetical protein
MEVKGDGLRFTERLSLPELGVRHIDPPRIQALGGEDGQGR